MSGILANEKAALAKEGGKLKKIFEAVKKFMAKEFLWVLFVALLALPIAFVITYVLENYVMELATLVKNYINGKPLILASYILSIAGIYFTRAIVGAINTLAKKPEKQ
jgi:hypothetical protein